MITYRELMAKLRKKVLLFTKNEQMVKNPIDGNIFAFKLAEAGGPVDESLLMERHTNGLLVAHYVACSCNVKTIAKLTKDIRKLTVTASNGSSYRPLGWTVCHELAKNMPTMVFSKAERALEDSTGTTVCHVLAQHGYTRFDAAELELTNHLGRTVKMFMDVHSNSKIHNRNKPH